MIDYSALRSIWPTLSGTVADKVATINAMTVVYPALASFAASAGNGNATHDAALGAAKVLMAWVTAPNAPRIKMSDPTVYATVSGMAAALVAQETAAPGSTGFTAPFSASLIGLSASTTPWWQANGLTGPVTEPDLANAGGLS